MDIVEWAIFTILWAVVRAETECELERNMLNPFQFMVKVTAKDLFIGTGSLVSPRTVVAPYSAFVSKRHHGVDWPDLMFVATRHHPEQKNCSIQAKYSKVWTAVARNEVWFNVDPPFKVASENHPYLMPVFEDMEGLHIRRRLSEFQNYDWYEPCIFATWESNTLDAKWRQRGVRIISGQRINFWAEKLCAKHESVDRYNACLLHASKANFFAVPTFKIPDDWIWMAGSVAFCWGRAMGHLREVLLGDTARTREIVLAFESLEESVFYIRNSAMSEWPEFKGKHPATA